MLDSRSSVSLIQLHLASKITNSTAKQLPQHIRLITASGEELPIKGYIQASIQYDFVVTEQLVASVILGVDFFHNKGLVLDFTTSPVSVHHNASSDASSTGTVALLFQAAQQTMMRICTVLPNGNGAAIDVTDECSVPRFSSMVEFPQCQNSQLAAVMQEFSCLFTTTPGRTDVAYHSIPTTGNPVKVPPRRIPAHYREEVCRQIQEMLDQGIIRESSSP